MLETIFGKVNRSGFHHLADSALPVRSASEMENGFDVLGGFLVLGLSDGMLVFMRLVLAN